MTKGLIIAAGVLVGIAGVAHADAAPRYVPEMAGIRTDLGNNSSALTYWVDEAQGTRVVTTIDSCGRGSSTSRFSRKGQPSRASSQTIARRDKCHSDV